MAGLPDDMCFSISSTVPLAYSDVAVPIRVQNTPTRKSHLSKTCLFIISWALVYSAKNESYFNTSFALWCVTIPLFDFFTVIIIRLFEKRSLLVASNDHVHHFLQNLGSNFVHKINPHNPHWQKHEVDFELKEVCIPLKPYRKL